MTTATWREYGAPLVVGSGTGRLTGLTVAVKDLFAVRGHAVGAGNPAWLARAPLEREDATAVSALLEAGADVAGIARTDEFAYSLAGTNAHYGTPPNPAAPGRISGGSTSGPATAVALGQASIGLGTDTGGSIRVPAAYQGLFGIRTTHDVVDRTGLLPLAPTFDTVGWLTRDAATLAAVGDVLLPPDSATGTSQLVVVPDLLWRADADVAAAITAWLPRTRKVESWPLDDLPVWREAFVTWQAWQAWESHGAWLADRLDTLGPDVRARFEIASTVTEAQAAAAYGDVLAARAAIRDLVGERLLVLPSAPSTAPALGDRLADRLQAARAATVELTCIAGLGGLPAVNVPLRTAAGLPCGACLVAAPGRDRELLAVARTLTS